MNKAVALLLILVLAPIIGGVYGVLHDQVTYSVSEEYYTKFKFRQFGLDDLGMGDNKGTRKKPEIILDNPRLGVSIVGFLATWWVGLIIGIILGIVGLFHRNGKEMFRISMKACLMTIGIAFVVGLIGLAYGKLSLVHNPPNWRIPEHVINRNAFIAVGSMHNFSYLGGLIGMLVSCVYSLWMRRKIKHAIANE